MRGFWQDWKGVEAGGSMADVELSASLYRRLAALENVENDDEAQLPSIQVGPERCWFAMMTV